MSNANIRKGSPSSSGPSIPRPTRHLQRYARCQQQPYPSTGREARVGGTWARTADRVDAQNAARGWLSCHRHHWARDTLGVSDTAFDQIRSDASTIIERLVDIGIQSRGPMLPPTMDITSPAYQQLKDDGALSSAGFPSPIYGVYGHIERLLIASDDQARCVAHLLAKPEPSWFGHLASIRSTVESLSRIWFLADPAIASVERATRLANEQLYEISHATNMLKDYLTGMPAGLYKQAETHLADRRKGLSDWAKAQGVVNPGGFLGAKRPGPSELLAAVYADSGLQDAAALGAWNYSELSKVAHGLPEGMARYLVPAVPGSPDAHPHLVLTIEDLIRSLESLVTLHEAVSWRLAAFFRWELSAEMKVVTLEARQFVNHYGGLT